MNIHWLQHVPFEGLGCIAPWLEENGHDVSCTRLWAGEKLPNVTCQPVGQASLYSESLCSSIKQESTRSRIREARPTICSDMDGLIIMGGPMSITDEVQCPWLAPEKAFIKESIAQNKPVLGICLGAQLIADCLGATVQRGRHREIGFFPLRRSASCAGQAISKKVSNVWKLPDEFTAFHWHGDTFDIPEGAVRLASSEATANQAFVYNDKVLALQFHLETTEASLMSLYENSKDEITGGPFIQTLEEMKPFFPTLGTANAYMRDILNRLFGRPPEAPASSG